MKLLLPGGSGQVGTHLARAFHADGHDVVVLSRQPAPAPWRVVVWDGETVGDWRGELDGADVVFNLAGRSVNCRYSRKNRRAIIDSRVKSTQAVGKAVALAARPPRVWLQASTATIYAHRFDTPNDEATGILGGNEPDAPDTWRFSIEVATSWERAAVEARTPHTRQVLLPSAVTLSPDRGGIFDVLLGLVRRGLGGTAGDGKQYVSGSTTATSSAPSGSSSTTTSPGRSTWPPRTRSRTPSSCGPCGKPGGRKSACRRRGGCSKSGRS